MTWLSQIPLSSLASGIIGGIVVAIASHLLSAQRERSRKLSEMRIEMLMDAWKKVEAATFVKNSNGRDKPKTYLDLEDAHASIMLLGTARQIEIAKKFTNAMSQNSSVSSLELLNLLRDDLRKELRLSDTTEGYTFLRIALDE